MGARASGVLSAFHPIPGAVARIGRAEDNDIVVDDLAVSGRHAELRNEIDGQFIVDLGSGNGTFLNGRRVKHELLHEGDVVGIGNRAFRLRGAVLEEYVDEGDITFAAAGLSVRTDKGRTLLNDVGFALEERSFLAIVGPSGAGKSTLLGALTGARPATDGKVLYAGRDLYAEYEQLRQRLGFVPQDDVLHAALPVRRALEYSAELRFPPDVAPGERGARIAEVLDELGLAATADQPIDRLSGGQRRRVAVAVELLTKPSLLFLDEPTSGLDPGFERSLMLLLRQLADDGRTMVVVTHSVQSLHLCDRVLVLAPGGSTAYFGPPELAPGYFGCDDFEQIFQAVAGNGRDWSAAYRGHPYHDTYARPAAGLEATSDEPPPTPTSIRAIPRTWFAQFWMQARRYAQVLAADRRNLQLLAAQPVLLALLMVVALPSGELDAPGVGELRAVSRAGLVLLVIVLGATWLGASNAIREIVKELPILTSERAVGLRVSAYVASKVVVLGALTTAQCTVLAVIALLPQGSHGAGSLLPAPMPEFVIAAVLAGLAAMALGLMVSAIASTVDRAMTVLPIILIFQMLLAMGGVFPDVVDKPGLRQASYLTSAKWAFDGMASTAELERLQALERVVREAPTVTLADPLTQFEEVAAGLEPDPRWSHGGRAWLENMGALLLLGLVATLGTVAALSLRGRR